MARPQEAVGPNPHSWTVPPAESQRPGLLVPAVQMSWGRGFPPVAGEAFLLVTEPAFGWLKDPQVLKGQSD